MFQLLKNRIKKRLLKKARETKSVKAQMNLAKNTDPEIRAELLKNGELFFQVLECLVYDDSTEVRRRVAENVKDSSVIDEIILNEEDQEVLYGLTFNRNLSEMQEFMLVKKGNKDIKVRIAMNTKSKKVMMFLAKDPDEYIRIMLTNNDSLDYEISKILSKDKSAKVRYGIAIDTSYRDILEELGNDPDEDVQIAVGENSCTDNYTLYKLSKSPNVFVRAAVAANENLSRRIKKRLSNDPEPLVKKRINGGY